MNSGVERWPTPEFKAFRDLLLGLRFICRDHLPKTKDWDADWPSFRDDPYRYFMIGPDKHQRDIWLAMTMERNHFYAIEAAAAKAALEDSFDDSTPF